MASGDPKRSAAASAKKTSGRGATRRKARAVVKRATGKILSGRTISRAAKVGRRHGVYVARFTHDPHGDARRKWAGWMGTAADSPGASIEYAVFVENLWDVDIESDWRAWQREKGIPRGQQTEWDRDTYMPEEFLVWLGRRYGIKTRQLPGSSKWVTVDHEGMAVFALEARTLSKAVNETKELAHERRYSLSHGAKFFEGDSTIGSVRYVREVEPGLHLFLAERVESEQQARTR